MSGRQLFTIQIDSNGCLHLNEIIVIIPLMASEWSANGWGAMGQSMDTSFLFAPLKYIYNRRKCISTAIKITL